MRQLQKLNLGSGDKRIDGFVSVDYSAECQPDVVADLETTPWPFDSDSTCHIVMNHVLEHIGQTPRAFLLIMQELYRICADGAIIEVTVPHHAHENFYSDPTHVRPITPMTMALFDRDENLRWRAAKAANSPLALQCGVNFKLLEVQNRLDASVHALVGELQKQNSALADLLINHGRNVISEVYMKLKVIKA